MNNLPLFSLTQAIELIGSHQQATQLIEMLINDLPTYATQIQQFAQANARRELRDLMHAMTGAAAYCGVPKLSAQLQALHNYLKNPEQPITADTIAPLLATMKQMIASWPNQ